MEPRVEIKKASGETVQMPIQTVHFSKDRFKSPEEGARWLDANGLSARAGAHHYPDSWGFDQTPRDRFVPTSLKSVPAGEGVRIVVGLLGSPDPLDPAGGAPYQGPGAPEAETPEEEAAEPPEGAFPGEVNLLPAVLPGPAPEPQRAAAAAPAAFTTGDRVRLDGIGGVVRRVSGEPFYGVEFDGDPNNVSPWLPESCLGRELSAIQKAKEVALIEKAGGGLMIALVLEPEDAQALAMPDGESPEDLHCTLAYCGKLANLPPDAIQRVSDALDEVCREFGPVVGVVGGVGVFNNSPTSDGMDVVHASFDSPVLPALRDNIVKAIDRTGLSVKKEHGFDPHITLKYVGPHASGDAKTHVLPRVPTKPLVFKSLSIRGGKGGVKIDKPFQGARIAKAKEEPAVKATDLGDEGGDARGQAAVAAWADSWQTQLPPSGCGVFVYQDHWRGLTEEESKLDEEALLKTAHSVHGDVRLGGRDGLWGFSVFLGKTADLREEGGDRLGQLKPDDALQGAWKGRQPASWLDVGVRGPLVTDPGGPGATPDAYAKFFAVDWGRYDLGVCREHAFEVFFHGVKVSGRYLFQFAQFGAKREWIVSKPADQTPIAEREEFDAVAADVKSKGQRWLWWGMPGVPPRLVDVTKWEPRPKLAVKKSVEKEFKVPISKMDAERQIVYGVVLEPGYYDAENDTMPAAEIEKSAHGFMEKWRTIGVNHQAVAAAVPVESWIAPMDFRLGGTLVKKGSWVLGVKVNDKDLWEKIRSGRYRAFSVGGFGRRRKVGASKRV